jgi:heme-degrading monooxygenase HmoA
VTLRLSILRREAQRRNGDKGEEAGVHAAPLTTVTLCGYGRGEKLWAFNRMGSARREVARTPGLRFWKLLGVGLGNGFSLRPDFSRYGLLAVWDDEGAAAEFFKNSPVMESYRRHAEEVWTVQLRTAQAHGRWSGVNPFLPALSEDSSEDSPAGARPSGPSAAPRTEIQSVAGHSQPPNARPVAVLTRATIRIKRLRAFWGAVPATTRELDAAEGLVASIGTGEAPWLRPATFSIWRDEIAMRRFAYRAAAHREAIRRRTEEGWYAEELFARFVPIKSEGSWGGRDPLAGLL